MEKKEQEEFGKIEEVSVYGHRYCVNSPLKQVLFGTDNFDTKDQYFKDLCLQGEKEGFKIAKIRNSNGGEKFAQCKDGDKYVYALIRERNVDRLALECFLKPVTGYVADIWYVNREVNFPSAKNLISQWDKNELEKKKVNQTKKKAVHVGR